MILSNNYEIYLSILINKNNKPKKKKTDINNITNPIRRTISIKHTQVTQLSSQCQMTIII